MIALVLLAGTGLLAVGTVVVAAWLILAGRPVPGAPAAEADPPARLAPTLPSQVWQPSSPAFPPTQSGPRLGWSETGWWAQEAEAWRSDDGPMGSAA